jgi:hypothetical protein
MSAKNKNNNTFENILATSTTVAQGAGLVLMAAATTLGLVETNDHQNTRVSLNAAPVYIFAGENEDVNAIRRERTEETGPHYVNLSVTQRTPGRTGKQ